METPLNPKVQQKLAKLNLLAIDDDPIDEERKYRNEESQQWGRSVQTQTFLREKISQLCKFKRKSHQQSAIQSITREESPRNTPLLSDKELLKEMLQKLDSKEIKRQKPTTLRTSLAQQNSRFSLPSHPGSKYHSNRTTIEHSYTQQRSQQKPLKQSIQNGENNFILKKIEFKSGKKINKLNEQALFSIDSAFVQPYGDELMKKRQFFTECKIARNFRRIAKKNTENKENEVCVFISNPLSLFKGRQSLKTSVLICKNQQRKESLVSSKQITKKTFQILQQINRSKSINTSSKLTSQSLKLKRPEMTPYSRVIKDRSLNFYQERRPKSNGILRKSSESIWAKLQIRR